MDITQRIDEAKQKGLSSYRTYEPGIRYFNAIKTFLDHGRHFFGLTRWDDEAQKFIPSHINSKHNPYPCLHYKFATREKMKWGWWFALAHLYAEPIDDEPVFSFLVNGWENRNVLCVVDIDHDKDNGESDSHEVAQRIVENEFQGKTVFVESSRNCRGCYVWFIVRRRHTPRTFDKMLCRFGRYLRQRYTGKACHVDAVKCTVGFKVRNPRFDWNRKEEAKVYNTKAHKTKPEFVFVRELEYTLHCRGVLGTMPCAGALARGDEGHVRAFVEFAKTSKDGLCVNEIDEFFLSEKFKEQDHPPVTILPPSPSDKRLGAQPLKRLNQAQPSCSPRKKGNGAWQMLNSSDVLQSRWGAFLYANQLYGRKATPEEACHLYEQHGAATGATHEERLGFFRRIEPMVAAPSPRGDPNWFTLADIEAMERRLWCRIDERVLDQANERLRKRRRGVLTYTDISQIAVWQRKCILDHDGYCSHSMIKGFASSAKRLNPKQKNYHSRQIVEAFELLKGIDFSQQITEANHFEGTCRRYSLGCAPNLLSEGGEQERGMREAGLVWTPISADTQALSERFEAHTAVF